MSRNVPARQNHVRRQQVSDRHGMNGERARHQARGKVTSSSTPSMGPKACAVCSHGRGVRVNVAGSKANRQKRWGANAGRQVLPGPGVHPQHRHHTMSLPPGGVNTECYCSPVCPRRCACSAVTPLPWRVNASPNASTGSCHVTPYAPPLQVVTRSGVTFCEAPRLARAARQRQRSSPPRT